MKEKKGKIFIALLLMAVLATGCSGSGNGNNNTQNNTTNSNTTNSNSTESSSDTGSTESGGSVTLWLPWTSQVIQTAAESLAWQEVSKRTGVEINFESPPAGQEAEAFNLMLASGTYPDLIKDQGYNGGGLKAVADGVYLKLNDYLDTHLPYYNEALGLSKAIEKQSKEDDGTIWSFKMIQPAEEPSWAGPAIRMDYLERVGLEMPVTIDDWYKVLVAFRDQLNIEAPMLLNMERLNNSGSFVGAFDSGFTNFINRDGVVEYGPIHQGYREWLEVMHKWYSEGLIDQNFMTRDSKSEEAYISNGKAGAFATLYYGEFTQYTIAGKGENEAYSLQPAQYPVANAGEKVEDLKIGNKNWEVRGNDVVVSAQSKNIDAALKLMDYWYSDEGFMIGNYGIEGEHYDWIDEPAKFEHGVQFFPPGLSERVETQRPAFHNDLLSGESGISFSEIWVKFKLGNDAYLRNPLYYVSDSLVLAAMQEWDRLDKSYMMPPLSQTEQESKRISDVMTSITTYKDEMVYKFIIGDEPLSNFDAYVAQIKAMGIEEITQIKQEQLNRYFTR